MMDNADDAAGIPCMPRNFSWLVVDRLAGMGFPTDEAHFRYLLEINVRGLISLTDDRVPDTKNFQDIDTLFLKVQDFTPPTISQIEECLRFIDACHQDNKAVAVHCAHGKGRTGTVLACYLVRNYKLGASEAIRKLREMRPGSVETREQEDMVSQFETKWTAQQ